MFIDVSPQEARKGVAPLIRVATATSLRIDGKPDRDEVAFEEAARLALADALGHGYRSVAFESVAEFIAPDNEAAYRVTNHTGKTLRDLKRVVLRYEYVWTFTAHNPADGDAES